MEIKSFEDLTQFIYEEYGKLQTSFEVQNPSTAFIKFVEDTLMKYTSLYDKPLKIKEKKEIRLIILKIKNEYALKFAIETMPHSFIWKMFHRTLWQKIKQQELQKLEEKKKNELENYSKIDNDNQQAITCEITKPCSLPPVDNEEE